MAFNIHSMSFLKNKNRRSPAFIVVGFYHNSHILTNSIFLSMGINLVMVFDPRNF